MRSTGSKPVHVLAVASAGGHWVQLRRLEAAFVGARISWLSTQRELSQGLDAPLHVVTDANMWQKLALLKMFLEVLWVILRVRPDVVVTTGAAPGFAAIAWGRLFGARTIWIDSIANSETLSASGRHAGRIAHVWLTQWEHLARPGGPGYWGAVL